ncbi:hypothetical protein AYI69_g7022 [Smittium culicis]|uniref:Uncharacterized protein n=1 Tax=Smittium culicis TaxID=133412 RepID=A0A1R1XUV4_9FUNG|nr:hypothetical protein AYI69_g10631 [Smittium culicis]OMJ18443.1 hypothetical protein AYI69_g7022 [Smittium culicis]
MNHTVPLLILGKGFIGTYVADLCASKGIRFVATTTDGRDGTTKFALPKNDQPAESFLEAARNLPSASSVLVTFPLDGKQGVENFVDSYTNTRPSEIKVNWIYLGSTGVFTHVPSNRNTPRDKNINPTRQESEDCFIDSYNATVL